MTVREIIEKLDEIIDTVDDIESDLSNLIYELNDVPEKVDKLGETVDEIEETMDELKEKLVLIMHHFEIEERKVVFLTQRKGINRELLKRLVAYGEYDYGQIAEYMGCSELEVTKIIEEMIDAGEIEAHEREGETKK